MGKRIHTILFYTLLLSVYGIFFSVESFFNFEGQGNVSVSQLHSGHTKAFPSHSSTSHLRLNKRYHQENVPPCTVYSVEAPVRYATPQILVLYRNSPLPAAVVVHHPLRGPPVVA